MGRDASRSKELGTFLVLAAGIVLVLILGRRAAAWLPTLIAGVAALGAWGPAAYIALYVVAVVALVPASILTLAAGALFGLARGTAYTFVAATVGATAAFLIARYVRFASVYREFSDVNQFTEPLRSLVMAPPTSAEVLPLGAKKSKQLQQELHLERKPK